MRWMLLFVVIGAGCASAKAREDAEFERRALEIQAQREASDPGLREERMAIEAKQAEARAKANREAWQRTAAALGGLGERRDPAPAEAAAPPVTGSKQLRCKPDPMRTDRLRCEEL